MRSGESALRDLLEARVCSRHGRLSRVCVCVPREKGAVHDGACSELRPAGPALLDTPRTRRVPHTERPPSRQARLQTSGPYNCLSQPGAKTSGFRIADCYDPSPVVVVVLLIGTLEPALYYEIRLSLGSSAFTSTLRVGALRDGRQLGLLHTPTPLGNDRGSRSTLRNRRAGRCCVRRSQRRVVASLLPAVSIVPTFREPDPLRMCLSELPLPDTAAEWEDCQKRQFAPRTRRFGIHFFFETLFFFFGACSPLPAFSISEISSSRLISSCRSRHSRSVADSEE